MSMSPSEAAFWRACYDSFPFFCEHVARIRVNVELSSAGLQLGLELEEGDAESADFDPDLPAIHSPLESGWQFVPFKLNDEQLDLHDRVMFGLKRGKPVRILVLKGRKLGISTYVQVLAFWLGTFRKAWESMVVAHQASATAKIAQISADLVDNLDPEYRCIGARKVRGGVVWGTKSSIELYTQRSDNAPRGASPGLIHVSELGLWDSKRAATTAEDALQAFMGTQSIVPNTICIIESTAKGAQGAFHDRYQLADANRTGIWQSVFYPWHTASKPHALVLPEDRAAESQLAQLRSSGSTDLARALVQAHIQDNEWARRAHDYGLTIAQVRWAMAQVEIFGNKIARFDQEFPLTPRHAFVSSGSHAIADTTLQAIRPQAPISSSGPLMLPGDMVIDEIVQTPEGWPRFSLEQLRTQGSEWVFFEPIPDRKRRDEFTIGGDVSGGGGADYASLYVHSRTLNKQVAHFYANDCTPERLAEQMFLASILYGCTRFEDTPVLTLAHVVPELNNHGHVVVTSLRRWRHDNLYRRRLKAGVNSDERQWGFETNARTRPQLLTDYLEYLAKNPSSVTSFALRAELGNFIRDKDGKLDHVKGKTSDAIISAALAIHGASKLSDPSEPWKEDYSADLDDAVDLYNHGGYH